MTLAALIDLGVDLDAIQAGIDSLGLPGVSLNVSTVIKGGFRATYVRVEHPEQHAHRHLADIEEILERADRVSEPQKELARRIFHAVARAEATVHGSTMDRVHFHEVGAIDSIVDIVGAAIGFDLLGADQIVCSRIPTGYGQIKIDHGICTVPAPGTAELLKGIPLAHVPVEAELTTPTGAAIVATLVDRFDHLPEMTIESIGYGAGTRDFPQRANLLRVFVGDGKQKIVQGHAALGKIAAMKKLAADSGLPNEGLAFMYDTFEIIAVAREYYFGQYSPALRARLEDLKKRYKDRHETRYSVKMSFDRFPIPTGRLRVLFAMLLRDQRHYRLLDRVFTIWLLGLIAPLLREVKFVPKFAREQAMGIKAVLK